MCRPALPVAEDGNTKRSPAPFAGTPERGLRYRDRFADSNRSATARKTMAFNLFGFLMPAEEAFTPLFCEQAQCIVQAAAELRQMLADDTSGEQRHVATIREIEMAADAVARRIFIGANRTSNA